MKFAIVCVNNDFKTEAWFYDNETNEICVGDLSNPIVDLRERLNIDPPKKPYLSFQKPTGFKSREVRHLRIQVGLNCNFNCSYCAQAKSRNKVIPIKSSEVSIVEKLKKQNISIKEDGAIGIWGGEPLVYWKKLLKLIPELRAEYPKCKIYLITNGSLLTKEKVDFLFKYNVRLTVSHDAQGFNLRDKNDPLKNPISKEAMLYAHRLSKNSDFQFGFNVVLSKANLNVMEIGKWFDENFIENTPFSFEGAVVPNSEDELLDNSDFYEFVESMVQACCGTKEDEFSGVKEMVAEFIRTIALKKGLNTQGYRCDIPREDSLVVDLNGNVIDCHNFSIEDHKCGSLDEFDNIKTNKMIHFSERPNCKDCLTVHLCKGECPLISDEKNHDLACHNKYFYTKAIFYTAWFWMFQRQIIDVRKIGERINEK